MLDCIFKLEEDIKEGKTISIYNICELSGEMINCAEICSNCIYKTNEKQARSLIKKFYFEAMKQKKIRKILFNK